MAFVVAVKRDDKRLAEHHAVMKRRHQAAEL
jgi:hypothetical protein